MQPVETPTIMQGLGHVAQVISGGIQEGRAQRSEAEARDALAKIQATVGLEGATPAQLAEIGRYDPQIAQQYREEAVQARRDAAERAEAARLHEDTQAEGRSTLAATQGFTTKERVAEQDFTHAERAGPGGTQEFQTGEREGGETAASQLQDNRIRADAEQADLERRWKEQQPGSAGAQVFQDYQNGKFGELGSTAAIKARELAFEQATGHSGDVLAREQLASTEKQAADKAAAEVKAADVLAGRAQTDTAKAVQDEKLGKFGIPGSPDSIAKMNAEIQFATTHKGPDTVLMQGDTTIRKELYTQMGKTLIPQYMQEAAQAGNMTRDMEMLDQLDPFSEGPIAGNIVAAFPFLAAFDSQAAAFESIVKRAAPQTRVEGSGSTSDIEYQGMLDSMPQLRNYPEANALIRETIKARAAIALQRGQIINEFVRSGKDPTADTQLFDKLAQLDAQSIMNPRLQAMLDEIKKTKSGAAATAPGAAGGGVKKPANPALEDALGRY